MKLIMALSILLTCPSTYSQSAMEYNFLLNKQMGDKMKEQQIRFIENTYNKVDEEVVKPQFEEDLPEDANRYDTHRDPNGRQEYDEYAD